MTTIDEMDEYFNFDDASHPSTSNHQYNTDLSHLNTTGPGLYDIDLAFAQPEADENSFTCLQHFSAQEDQLPQDLQNVLVDTATLSANDLMDFPRWIDGMTEPINPCTRCRKERTHCKVIKEGFRKGSCTSCVALARSCSLTYDPNMMSRKSYDYRASGKVDCAVDDQGNHAVNEEETMPSQKECENCKNCLQPCKVNGKDGITSCENCLTLNRPCSLVQYNLVYWNIANDPAQSNALASPMSPFEDFNPYSGSRSNSSTDLLALKSSTENIQSGSNGDASSKVGARFSRQSVRILKDWLGLHHRHPYPTDAERENLMAKTGLNKTQITNWLANARRRGKSRPTITPPTVGNYANAMDIPRRATPALENMNPLERWKNSPPEHEPASASAIAKAVTSSTFSSGMESPYTSYGDDGSNRSLCNASSTSSLGTSHSSAGSFASAYSHKSRGSFGSFSSFGNNGRRRRRRQAPKPVKAMAAGPARTFQCTFCTESFKTKHDWQRHEKSLHLSLERWICCPEGSITICKEYSRPTCVYCGHPNPPKDHAEVHNHSSCAEKPIEERTFYRKDHLRQHLHLVHDVKFLGWSMEPWKATTPEIRSRCGFCGVMMDTWTARVDHLAEHFKNGRTMADWKGDWGFDPQITNIVENGIPPYLIHEERNSLRPFEASPELPTLENLLKSGLIQYVNDKIVQGVTPTDEELLYIARQIIHNLDAVVDTSCELESSWLRDLILFSENEDQNDKEHSLNNKKSNNLEPTAFQKSKDTGSSRECSKERALRDYVTSIQMLGLTATDSDLQSEACRIIDEAEKASSIPSKGAASWLKYLIRDSTEWLAEFRRRAGLPRSSEIVDELVRSKDDKTIDNATHNYARLEAEMKDYVQLQFALGIRPSDSDLQRHARLIVYGNDDPWNQTWADDSAYLHLFKTQNDLAPSEENGSNLTLPTVMETTEQASSPKSRTLHWDLENTEIRHFPITQNTLCSQPLHKLITNQPSTNSSPTQPLKYFLNDANCYNRLFRELSRFVARCMSPNNPNQHVPTDAEIQNQARWVVYDDDDPWNQTAADNAEWLIRFKREVSLSPSNSGPGLPTNSISWQIACGGSGFAPPFVNPRKDIRASNGNGEIDVNIARIDESEKIVKVRGDTANKYIKSLKQRYPVPAQVFCSRELENGLLDYVKFESSHGRVPTDAILRAKARDILRSKHTPADDAFLLKKFKTTYGVLNSPQGEELSQNSSPLAQISHQPQPQTYQSQVQSIPSLSNYHQPPAFLNDDELLANFDMELMNNSSFQTTLPTDFSTPSLLDPNAGLGFDNSGGVGGLDVGLDLDMDLDMAMAFPYEV